MPFYKEIDVISPILSQLKSLTKFLKKELTKLFIQGQIRNLLNIGAQKIER